MKKRIITIIIVSLSFVWLLFAFFHHNPLGVNPNISSSFDTYTIPELDTMVVFDRATEATFTLGDHKDHFDELFGEGRRHSNSDVTNPAWHIYSYATGLTVYFLNDIALWITVHSNRFAFAEVSFDMTLAELTALFGEGQRSSSPLSPNDISFRREYSANREIFDNPLVLSTYSFFVTTTDGWVRSISLVHRPTSTSGRVTSVPFE